MALFLPESSEDPMQTLCRMTINIRYEDLPRQVADYAKKCILDTWGVTIGGSSLEGIPEIVHFVKENGGKPESLIPFYGGRVPAAEAALAIGPMSRAMDLGDVHEEAAHCSEYILPALMAALGLKTKVKGKDFLTAFVIGQEVLIRIGMAFRLVSRGGPANFGGGQWIFGCVAAVGKLLGLTQEELENAQGIARGKTQPHDLAMFSPATLMVRVHHGFIAHDSIEACLLAARGITGPRESVLTGPRGYLSMAKWETSPDDLLKELGEKWEMLKTEIKPYAACKGTHTAIAGLLELMEKQGFKAEDVLSIEIDESTINWVLVCTPRERKWNPQTVAECQFSMPFVLAAAAFNGEVFLNSYSAETLSRRDIREFMSRVSAREDKTLPDWASRVRVILKSGNVYVKDCYCVKGHPDKPFTVEEIVQKFKKCLPYSAYKISTNAIDSIVNSILDLESIEDVESRLILPLTPVEQ